MRTIVVPVKNKKITVSFEDSSHFIFYRVLHGMIIKEEIIPIPTQLLEIIPNWLADNDVTDVIAVEIGLKTIQILNQNKINVFIGVKMKDPKDLVQEYINRTLETHDNLFNK